MPWMKWKLSLGHDVLVGFLAYNNILLFII